MFGQLQFRPSSDRGRPSPKSPLKSIGCWVATAGLVCLPGCSGCESQTSTAKPPVAEQAETPTAENEKRQSDAWESAAQDGSLTEIRPARGKADSNASDTTANTEGESSSSSGTENSSKSATGGETAQKDSKVGSAGSEAGSGGGSGSGKAKSSGQIGKPRTPGEAVATAQTLKQRSDKAAAGKEYGQAFELATKAWESVQTFPKDVACSEMSSDLQRRIDELGTLANSQRGADLKRDKPLIVR